MGGHKRLDGDQISFLKVDAMFSQFLNVQFRDSIVHVRASLSGEHRLFWRPNLKQVRHWLLP